jgi:hypothetical protein
MMTIIRTLAMAAAIAAAAGPAQAMRFDFSQSGYASPSTGGAATLVGRFTTQGDVAVGAVVDRSQLVDFSATLQGYTPLLSFDLANLRFLSCRVTARGCQFAGEMPTPFDARQPVDAPLNLFALFQNPFSDDLDPWSVTVYGDGGRAVLDGWEVLVSPNPVQVDASVPEPSTVVLLLAGLLALACRRRAAVNDGSAASR